QPVERDVSDPARRVVVPADPAPPHVGALERVLHGVLGHLRVAARDRERPDHRPVRVAEHLVEVDRRRAGIVGAHAPHRHGLRVTEVWWMARSAPISPVTRPCTAATAYRRTVPVPLPAPGEEKLTRPTAEETQFNARGVATASAPADGLTDLQRL